MSRQFTINTSSEPRDFTIVEGGDTRTFTITTGVGPRGYDATITVGTVTTGNAGTNAIVTNVGTTSAAIFDFTIPRGDTGATGPNSVSTSTSTNISGILKGNGTSVLAAVAGTDYLAPTGDGSGLTGLKVTRTFANQAAVDAATPDFEGQLALRLDTNLLLSSGIGTGEWYSGFTFDGIDVGANGIACSGSIGAQSLTGEIVITDTLQVGSTSATGTYSAAFGSGTTASGLYSFAGGLGSSASGDLSFAFGGAIASGTASFAFGDGAIASGDASFAFGTDANAVHQGASVETDSQTGTVTSSTTTDEKTFRFANGYRFLGGSATFDANVTVSGILYANHIHGNLAGSVYAHIRAGEELAKGDPVYISGSHGTAPNLIPIVSKADASNAAKMPAIGIMDADLANNANGHMVITGTIADLNTAAYAVNDTLYVASGGGLTATPPAANSQPVARVERSNANNGALIVKVNGLASNGGNGVSDANKLVRFSSAGTIPVASIGGLGTGVATFLATPTSANLAAAVTDETGSGSLVFATSPTITTPTLSRGSTGLVFTAQDNNNASCNLTTDASGRCFFTVNGKTNGTGNSGAYVQLNGFEEAWTTLNVTSNTSGQRVMRFGTLSNRFSIQRLNDAISSITATPFSFANNAPTNSFYMDSSGNIGLGTSSPTAFVDINSNTLRVRTARTPASATATGNAGDICWDANYIYVCTATNTWKRTAISTW